MRINVEFNDRIYQDSTAAELAAKGVPDASVAAALKVYGQQMADAEIDRFRQVFASQSPAKIAEYFVKEDLAKNWATAPNAEKALLLREAAARGMTEADMLSLITVKAGAFRQAALLMAALVSEAIADIDALPDTPATLPAAMAAIITTMTTQASAAIAAANSVIEGGS